MTKPDPFLKQTIRHALGLILITASVILFFKETSQKELGSVYQLNFSIFALLLFAAYIIKFYFDDYRFISSSFYQLFYYFGMLTSAAMISAGSHMYEVDDYGTANGVFWIIIIFAIVGLESAHIGYKTNKIVNRTAQQKKINKIFLKIFVYGTLTASLLILLVYGSPLHQEQGVTRVNFWGLVAPSYLSPIRILIFTTFFLAVVNFYQKKRLKKNILIEIMAILLYVIIAIFLLGEKFTAAIFFIFAWLIVRSSASSKNEVSKTFFKVFIVILISTSYVAFTYVNAGIGYEFILNRIALQGQVLWSTLNENFETLSFGTKLSPNIDFGQFTDIRKVIEERFLPSSTFDLNQISGTSLSGFFPAMPILIIGIPLAIVAHSFFSIYLGRVQAQLIIAIVNFDNIDAFLKYTIYYFLLAIWFVGNFNTLKIVFASYVFYFAYRIIKKPIYKQQRS